MKKNFLKNLGQDKVKWLATFFAAMVGLFFLIGGNPIKPQTPIENNSPEENKSAVVDKTLKQPDIVTEEKYLASKLQEMLQMVEGAGDVKVTIRLAGSSRVEYAVNTSTGTKTTQEKDQAGGTRVLTEDSDTGQLVLVKGNDGYEIPVLQQQRAPDILGVLVVAQGANNPAVKAELFRAVRVGLGVEPQNILVLPKEQKQVTELRGE